MQVSIRELKANPARAIALVQQGQCIQITSHRRVVAEPATKPFKIGKAIVFTSGPDGQNMRFCCFDKQINTAATSLSLPLLQF
jgi:hypothetical protein